MTKAVKAGFELDTVRLNLDDILMTKQIDAAIKAQTKYMQIVASIKELGIIEPPIVYPQGRGKYMLLDGHARIHALRDLGITEVDCLIATDDEAYTHNHKVNRIAPIQGNRMIMKALDAGVSAESIASALGLRVATIQQNRTMLKGICKEAVELLKDKPVALTALREFKRVKPLRQIEMAELMISSGIYTSTYAQALLVATPKEQLVESERAKQTAAGMKPEDLGRMQSEAQALEKEFLLVQESYERNSFDLTIARGYLKSLLDNSKVVRYLAQKHKELLAEFQRIVEAAAIEN
ncbi:MAG TPA: plasmid partitioning protein RepB C-terminal domain-containing protein [Kofleriaceae bacterium]|nr:plasmid partitioning protein RepB C-terminal domain-containing protein [Kofleriaceae bacterium]